MNDSKIYSYKISKKNKSIQTITDIISEFKRCQSIPTNSYRIIEKWTDNGEYIITFEYFNMYGKKIK